MLGGASAIVGGAAILAFATAHQSTDTPGKAAVGIIAALGAGVLWGTMYIPYRKAYISGMNPLSFVTIFTFGELGTVFLLAAVFHGGVGNLMGELHRARPMLFWPFLGGFCWVIGDLFQNFAAKYIGIGRESALKHQSALGVGLGRAGLWRVVGIGSIRKSAGHHRIADHDRGSSVHKFRGASRL